MTNYQFSCGYHHCLAIIYVIQRVLFFEMLSKEYYSSRLLAQPQLGSVLSAHDTS